MELRFKPCTVDECTGNAHRDAEGKRGFCNIHYQRFKRHGDPTTRLSTPSPAKDWLIAHVGHDDDACLKWPFHIGSDGYGRVHHFSNGGLTTASRLMCLLAHGEPPSAVHEAAHSCGKGNEGCVNPRHIYWATPTENQNERAIHNTSNRGERQWQSKLQSTDVLEIRRLLQEKMPVNSIASRFSVSRSAIKDIETGKNWSWLS